MMVRRPGAVVFLAKWKVAARSVFVSASAFTVHDIDFACHQDDSDRPLEAQWFYVPELDEDQERATLIKSMMPRPGKRNETKKYKQYYYRPLDKISRWDPEDEI